MKKTKRIIALMVSLCLIVALLAACGNNGDNAGQQTGAKEAEGSGDTTAAGTNETSSKWKVGDHVSLKWYINFNYHKDTLPWTEYPILKEVCETTGVYPEIIVPTGNEAEKLNLMIATNDMPDMLTTGWTDTAVLKLISQDMVYSYDELIEKYVPEFNNEIPDEVRNWLRQDDGKLYSLNSHFIPDYRFENKYAIGASTYNVRKDLYKEIGSPDMATPEGYYNALKAFKEKFPTIDGKPSIPLSLGGDVFWGATFFERSFGVKDYYEDKDYNISIKYKNPRYIEAAKYLNKLYREGLMDKETFIDKNEQLQEKLAGRIFACPSVYWFFDTANLALDKVKPDSHFIATEPMKAASEMTFSSMGRKGWATTLIPKKTEKPEQVIKFIRYLWGKDGNMLMSYGHEGSDYTIKDNTIYRSQQVKDEMAKDRLGFVSKTGMQALSYFSYPYYNEERVETVEVKANREMADKYAEDESEYSNINPDPTSPEGIINTQIEQIKTKMIPKIIMAESEEKAISEVDNMLNQMEKAGLSKLEKYWTDSYKAERKRVGLTTPPKMN